MHKLHINHVQWVHIDTITIETAVSCAYVNEPIWLAPTYQKYLMLSIHLVQYKVCGGTFDMHEQGDKNYIYIMLSFFQGNNSPVAVS